ncbi:MAG: thioredoxin [Bacteroidales bacterium]|nr:thioredoxin [Bacteroidales bacterium]
MTEVNNTNLKELLASNKVALVDFWATWCGPCRMLAPTVEEVAADYEGRALVAKCNVDDAEDVAAEFGIRSIPTLIFFKDGIAVDKTVGVVSKADIETKLNNLL